MYREPSRFSTLYLLPYRVEYASNEVLKFNKPQSEPETFYPISLYYTIPPKSLYLRKHEENDECDSMWNLSTWNKVFETNN